MDLYRRALELLELNRPFALAAVVAAWGSTPQKAGAKALFEAAGPVHGTLGGGCLEAESRKRALLALDVGQPALFELKLDDIQGWDDGLICGGKVQIFVDPYPARNGDVYREALDAADQGRTGALLTRVAGEGGNTGSAQWLGVGDMPGEFEATFAEDIAERIRAGSAGLVDANDGAVYFVEPVNRPPQVIIAGGGHIGKAVARQARLLGFNVTVIDDRPAFANTAHIPDAHTVICGDIPSEMAKQPIDPHTYVLIVTRGHRHDGAVLAACVHAPAAFIGMIGSKRKSALIRKSLVDEGIATQEAVDRVVSPVGLDIGAESVDEIAISIAAQLVAVRRKQRLDAAAMNFLQP